MIRRSITIAIGHAWPSEQRRARLTWILVITALMGIVSVLNGQQYAAIPSPGSQANSAGSTLSVSVTPPTTVGSLAVLGPITPSTTYAWSMQPVTCGPGGFPTCYMGGGPLQFIAIVSGAPGQSLALLYSSTLAVPLPLPLAANLMATRATPFGTLHLLISPTTLATGAAGVLVDGIGLGLNPALPASTNTVGVYSFPPATLNLGSGTFSGSPDLATQALVTDPTSPVGFTLSAAFTTAHHQ